MTNFSYNRDIPDGPNNPSVDQPDMKENTNSIDDLINVDHISFEQNNGGLHRQVSMPVLAAIPAGRIVNEGTLYTKTASGESQLFYTPDASTNEYQITKTISAQITKFGAFNIVGADQTGWTFLPGGLIMMYGKRNTLAATTSPIAFPFSFTNVFSITATLQDPIVVGQQYSVASVTVAGFNLHKLTASGTQVVNWMAIGN